MTPITNNDQYNAAIARGDYIITADNYLTVWLNGDRNDGYELHLDCGDWRWA